MKINHKFVANLTRLFFQTVADCTEISQTSHHPTIIAKRNTRRKSLRKNLRTFQWLYAKFGSDRRMRIG